MDETAPHVMEAQFDELIRTMLRMQPRHREVSVRDPEGQVEATYGPDGRLAKVTVEPRWQDKIEPGDLSTVLLTTIAEAQFEASGLNDDDRPEPTEEEDICCALNWTPKTSISFSWSARRDSPSMPSIFR